MTHSRLSVDSMCSYSWPFERELALWREIGVKNAGLLVAKVLDDPAKVDLLDAAGISISTLITGGFNLADRSTWEQTRALQKTCIDLVAAHKGHSIYFTSGRTVRYDWNEDLELLAQAVAPTVAYGRERGVIAAFEPTLRTSVSFCTSLADAIDVAERTGLGIVADFGNNWMERDWVARIRRAMPHIALMQIGDIDVAAPAGRVHIGKGDLPVERMIRDVLDAGYEGVFDLEVVSVDFAAETDEDELRNGILAASAMLERVCQ